MKKLIYEIKRLPQFTITGMSVVVAGSQSENTRTIADLWQGFNKKVKTITTRVLRKEW